MTIRVWFHIINWRLNIISKNSAKLNITRESVVFGPDIETTGLNPFEDKILTIQLRINGQNYIWSEWQEGSETKVISAFLSYWKNIPKCKRFGGATFIAFNVFHFDIPFVTERCRILGLCNPKLVWEQLVSYPAYVDLYQLLGDDFMGFARWKNLLVGKAKEYSGKDVPIFYRNREYDKILEYINDEMESLEKTYYAIKKEPFYKQLVALRRKAEVRG